MKRLAALISLVCGATCALLCWDVLGLIPHIPDELSYLYQGRIFAAGRLSVPPPEVPAAFTVPYDHILRDSQGWRAIYPPGWPLLLAIGWIVQNPWLVNPLLMMLATYGLFQFARQLFDSRTAIIAIIAFTCSPFVLLMGAGFMAHPSTFCLSIWCAYFLARRSKHDLLFAGMCGAFAFAIRPYTALFLLLPFVLWSLQQSRDRKRALLHLIAGAAPVLIFFCVYNALQFGTFFRTGYSYDPDAAFRGSAFQHLQRNLPWYFVTLNKSLWHFPWPDLLLLIPLLFPHRTWKRDMLLWISFLSLAVAYSCFYYRDIVYAGPRYVFEAAGFLAILAARSIRLLESWIERLIQKQMKPVLLLIFLYPLAVTLPAQMEYHKQAYHGQSRELIELVYARGIGDNALLLVSGDPHVFRTFYLENGLEPARSERVYARDSIEHREELLRKYRRDEIWSMHIMLKMLPGVNDYVDRALLGSVEFKRLDDSN